MSSAGGTAPIPAAPAQPQAAQPQHSWFSQISTFLLVFMFINTMFGRRGNSSNTNEENEESNQVTTSSSSPHVPSTTTTTTTATAMGKPLWSQGQPVSLYLFLSENETLPERYLKSSNLDKHANWSFHNLTFQPDDEELILRTVVEVGEHLAVQNGSYYIHVLYTLRSFIPKRFRTHQRSCVYERFPLVRFRPAPKNKLKKNLLTGEGATTTTTSMEVNVTTTAVEVTNANNNTSNASSLWLPYWQPLIVINPIADSTRHTQPLPDHFTPFFVKTSDGKHYYPILYNNEFWIQRADFVPLNNTLREVNLTVRVYPLSLFKWMLYVQMSQSFQMQESWGVVESEVDEMKRVFLETNPYLLGLTLFVSTLHMVFEYLAFKNDITFWKNRKDFTGLSGRTLMMNCYTQLIICLYLFDNDTSWTVLIPSALGVVLEFWKLRKIFGLERDPAARFGVRLTFTLSYQNTKTKQFDDEAMKYLFYLLIPGLIGYTIYSAMYEQYAGWYSFAIHTQVRFIYGAGFVMMTPQLFINYRLKSVAHLPWRTFTYKALNTFVDDLFAFIIKMPMMHRLACLRDDVIFVILLYQRWIYVVDMSRANEFGQSGDGGNAAAVEENKTATIEGAKEKTE